MSVLFAEGFTGTPVTVSNAAGASWVWGPTNGLYKLGWSLAARYNGTTGGISDDNNVIAAVEADPVFADRRQLRLSKNNTASTITLIQQAIQPVPTFSTSQKIIIGMTATLDTTTNAATNIWLVIGNQAEVTSSTLTTAAMNQLDGLLAMLRFDNDGTAQGLFPQNQNGAAVTIPNIVKGTFAHIEMIIEKDVPRTRVYINGNLVSDAPRVPSTLTGISLGQWVQTAIGGVHNARYSNIYALGMDAVHTARLGPAARVMEVTPPGDMEVHWTRPDGYASNAAVLGQLFNAPSPDYLAASNVGDYDVYNAPSAVAANAVKVYGAGLRVNAMTMAAGAHTLKPVVKTATGVHEIGNEAALQLGVLTPIFVDASVNPDTNAIWTPSAVTASGFGMKLKS